MPIVEACRNKNLTVAHWESINELIPNGKIDIDEEGFTLQSLIDLEVNQYQDDIVAISRRATGEAKLKGTKHHHHRCHDHICVKGDFLRRDLYGFAHIMQRVTGHNRPAHH